MFASEISSVKHYFIANHLPFHPLWPISNPLREALKVIQAVSGCRRRPSGQPGYISSPLFQTGYLTIDREEVISGSYFYQLRYPNREVYQSLNIALLDAWVPDPSRAVRQRKSLYRLLQANDINGMEQLCGRVRVA